VGVRGPSSLCGRVLGDGLGEKVLSSRCLGGRGLELPIWLFFFFPSSVCVCAAMEERESVRVAALLPPLT
jgi:hypothetical protein